MKPIVARVVGMKIVEGDPEKNPYGKMTITVECRAVEENLLAYSRLRNVEVVIESLQPEVWDETAVDRTTADGKTN